MPDTQETSTKNGFVRRLAHKALMPVVAAAASAAAGYAAKKGPQLVEERVLPKLKEAAGRAASTAGDAPAQAKSAAGSVGDLAGDLGDRARAAVGGEPTRSRRRTLSQSDLDRHVKRRAQARSSRRKTTTKG